MLGPLVSSRRIAEAGNRTRESPVMVIRRRSNGPFFGPIEMEQLWNRGGATGGKRSALRTDENGLIEPRTVATGRHPLPFGSHGKQGVCRGLPPVAGGPLPAKE